MMYGIIWRIARPPIVLAMYGWMTDCKLLARRVKTTGLAVRPPLTDVDVHRRRCLIDTRIPINCCLTLNRVRPARCSRGIQCAPIDLCLPRHGGKKARSVSRLDDCKAGPIQFYNAVIFLSFFRFIVYRFRSSKGFDTIANMEILFNFWGKMRTRMKIDRKIRNLWSKLKIITCIHI